jgi:hypothetical protein
MRGLKVLLLAMMTPASLILWSFVTMALVNPEGKVGGALGRIAAWIGFFLGPLTTTGWIFYVIATLVAYRFAVKRLGLG